MRARAHRKPRTGHTAPGTFPLRAAACGRRGLSACNLRLTQRASVRRLAAPLQKLVSAMTVHSILISGCSSGIGLCVAQGLRRRGYRVFAGARKEADVAALQAQGLEGVQLDVDDSGFLRRAVDEVLARTGGTLYALFNYAGYGQAGAVEDLSRAALRAQFETHLFGAQELTNLIIPVMRAQGHGRIIYNSSLLGLVAMPYRGAYNASKFAIEGLAD